MYSIYNTYPVQIAMNNSFQVDILNIFSYF